MAMERRRRDRSLVPWRPFQNLQEMERHFDNIFSRPFWPMRWRHFPTIEPIWLPAIEVFEKEDKFVVKADLPGMRQEDINVSVVGDTLTIKGERKSETEVKEEDYHCCERSYGSFSRLISLPSNVDSKNIEASYEDGVLEIILPKAPEVKPKKVTIATKKKEVK